jgi:hypothetical protein
MARRTQARRPAHCICRSRLSWSILVPRSTCLCQCTFHFLRSAQSFDEQILGVIQLVDETDDLGPIWDTKSSVVPIQWWHGPENGTLVDHAGSLGWMNFIGRWGNIGDRGFLSKIGAVSHVIDGPTGPNRDFRGNTNVSLNSVQLADYSVRWERRHQIRLAQYIRSS